MNKTAPEYYWQQLYDYESKIDHTITPAPAKRVVGRPYKRIPRTQENIRLTRDEKLLLRKLAGRIKVVLPGPQITHGQVVGFALHLMDTRWQAGQADNEIKGWVELWQKISEE